MKKNKLIWFSGLTLLFLFLLELGTRIFVPQPAWWNPEKIWEPVPGLEYYRKPNLDVTVNTGDRDIRLLTDKRGHRIGKAPAGTPDLKLLAIGDSFVSALQVAFEETMPAILSDSLEKVLDRKVEVTNVSRGGWNINHYLIAAKRELGRDSYDLVLVFVYLQNDLMEARVDWYPAGPPLEEKSPGQAMKQWFMQHSDLFRFIVYRSIGQQMKKQGNFPFLASYLKSNKDGEAWATTARLLENIDSVAQQKNTPVLFFHVPSPAVIDETALRKTLQFFELDIRNMDAFQPGDLLNRHLESKGLKIHDPTALFIQAYRSGKKNLYGRRDRHFGPGGHRLMADFMFPVVLELLEKQTRHQFTPLSSWF